MGVRQRSTNDVRFAYASDVPVEPNDGRDAAFGAGSSVALGRGRRGMAMSATRGETIMRIVLVAGEPVFRIGFRGVVESSGDLRLVAEVADARSAFRVIDAEKPDLVVMDVALQGMSGINATREVSRRHPGAHVLLIADWARERDVLDGFAAGARGFALKTEPVET